jgi:hypothetical protein
MTIKSIFVASPLSTHNLGTTSKNVKIQYGEMLDLSILSAILNVRHEQTASVSVLSSNAVDRVFEARSSQTKDYQIGIFCFSAAKTGCLWVRIMCESAATCLPTDCGLSELVL